LPYRAGGNDPSAIAANIDPVGKRPASISAPAVGTLLEIVVFSSTWSERDRMWWHMLDGGQLGEGRDTVGTAMPVRINDDQVGLAKFDARYGVRKILQPPLLDLVGARCG
jgi:hypothetical protein